ncbi:ECF-type sigma factor [Singulisphaera sp. PoT]|uniref:ECF-type sigma factor n=1 Tax=Singulisphaera sp. PoT TaxID=3411797 RepID=UPI003BF51293
MLNDILALVYDELRGQAAHRMKSETVGHTLEATDLVHEVYLRLFERSKITRYANSKHLIRTAAAVMGHVLTDAARARRAVKRGGGLRRRDLDGVQPVDDYESDRLADLIDLHDALPGLEAIDARAADVARLKVFLGLSSQEVAESLEISMADAEGSWRFARAWLIVTLRGKVGGH